MYTPLYKKPDVDLPYNIDTRYFKQVQDGIIKEKYEQRWVVLTEEVNSFIEALPQSFNELALSGVSRDDRGPLNVVTVNYGEAGLSEDYDGDGELTWWTLSNGIYTYHIKRWVENTPDAIKAFCEHCKQDYGYQPEEVSVSCNPTAGEPRVMCEGTFTPNQYEGGNNDFNEDNADENGMTEEANGIQFGSRMNSCDIPTDLYLMKKMGLPQVTVNKLLDIVEEEDGGRVIYLEAGAMGGRVKVSGWYHATDNNPQSLNKPWQAEGGNITRQNVINARRYSKNVPQATYPSISVSINTVIKKKEKITLQHISSRCGKAGTKSEDIDLLGIKMGVPNDLKKARDPEGHEYDMKTEWLNEGYSFDANHVKKKIGLNGQRYYEGNGTQNYSTISTLIHDTWA